MKVNGKDYPISYGKQTMFQTTNQIGNYRPSRILITGFALGGKAKVLSFGDACLGDI